MSEKTAVPAAADNSAGGGGADGAAKAAPGAGEGKTLLDGAGAPDEGAEAAPKGSGSLLDGAGEEADGGAGASVAVEPKADAAPTAEQIEEWCKGVPALDLGDGVKWDDAALRAMAPSLMALKREDSGRVIAAYAEYAKGAARAQAEAADAFNRGLVQQCRDRFGEDLKKVVSFAKKGGLAIFGEKIWNEMKVVPQFANNPDIMERLAEYGRSISTDSGKVTPSGADPAERGDVLHRMYGNVKV